jgi:putative toxin-antitoxin system antitoxin component (TIGR02293 family)
MVNEQIITKALGGTRILGVRITSPMEMIEAIQRGLPSKSVFFLQEKIRLDDKTYSNTLGVSSKWLSRYRNSPCDHINANVSDRLYRIAKILTLATDVLEDEEAARNWLHRSQPGLNERVPLELINTEAGASEVEELLLRIEYGIYS